jgi:circadian clock protein KaiC
MANTLFDSPLFVKKSRYVQELGSLEDVFDLLDEWPEAKRGDPYEVLLKACRMAAQGIFPLPAIRENVRRFLMKNGVLANIDEVPLIAKRMNDRNLGS